MWVMVQGSQLQVRVQLGSTGQQPGWSLETTVLLGQDEGENEVPDMIYSNVP